MRLFCQLKGFYVKKEFTIFFTSEIINSFNFIMYYISCGRTLFNTTPINAATANPEIVMLAKDNNRFMETIKKADLVIPDGIGVVIATKVQNGEVLEERVPGYDLVQNIMKISVKEGYKYYFFGSKPGVADEAAKKMRETYSQIEIVGTRDGYFSKEDEKDIIEDINRSGANILLVALGAPKQECWIEEHRDELINIKVAIGVGGSLDGMAGIVKRAPVMFQKLGLEWFYRLLKQPTRFKRMLVLPLFLKEVLVNKNK